jgi:D-3-phosphoglycerate dehydrogenase
MTDIFVAVTDSPAGDDLSVEREVFAQSVSDFELAKVPPHPPHVIVRALAGADAVLCMHAPIDRAVITALRRCRVIVRFGTGLDNIDVEAARAAGIAVFGVHDYCTEEVAAHTMALLLAWNRRILAYHAFVLDRRWNERSLTTGNWGCGPLTRLSGQTLGILGFGHIGRAVAARARAFGMPVLAWTRNPDAAMAAALGVELSERDEVLRRSDYLSLHLPLTAETRGLIDAAAIEAMKPGAVLINTARGALADEAALVAGLRSSRLGGALLDVYEEAPLPVDHPLRGLDNVILTPHVGFYSEEALLDLRRKAAERVVNYFSHISPGGRPI